jgi:DNA-binding CsgD family transcriptional regulator
LTPGRPGQPAVASPSGSRHFSSTFNGIAGDGQLVDFVARRAQGDRPTTAVLVPLLDFPGAYRVWLLISGTADLLASMDGPASPPGKLRRHSDALTLGEARVLRYLPTNLSAPEIARELHVSVNTVKTHQRHLYQKLGARSRTQAVEQARALGLL